MGEFSFDYIGNTAGFFSLATIDRIQFEKSKTRIWMLLPILLTLKNRNDGVGYILENTNGFVTAATRQNHQMNYCLGTLRNSESLASEFTRENYYFQLNLETTIADLLEWEKLRNGNEPIYNLKLNFQLSSYLFNKGNEIYNQTRKINSEMKIQWDFPLKVWLKFLEEAGLFHYQLMEWKYSIPQNYEESAIVQLVQESMDFFHRGGLLAWKNSIAKIREAMEHMEKMYPILLNGKAVDKKNTRDLSRQERWIKHYYSLKLLPHLAVHSVDDIKEDWSRDEAQMVLSSFIGFWKLRKLIIETTNPPEVAGE